MNITSENKDININKKDLDEIYKSLYNKEGIIDINDCKLEKYYSKNRGSQMNVSKQFPEYYNLNYILDNFVYLLTDKDIKSSIFEMKYSYPNLRTIKEFCPNSFLFKQIESFVFKTSSI